MKFLKLLILLLFPLSLTLTACSNDGLDDNGKDKPKFPLPGTKYIVAFALDTEFENAIGRGTVDDVNDAVDGDMVDGTDAESRVGTNGNYAIFFSANGRVYSVALLELTNAIRPEVANVERYYTAQFEPEELELPVSCILVVNASRNLSAEIDNLTTSQSLTDVLGLMARESEPREVGQRDGYFTMSNSVFVKDGALRTTVGITEANIQEGLIDETKIVHVQIERMVAKYSMRLPVAAGETPYGGSFDGIDVFTPEDDEIVYCKGFADDGSPVYEVRNWQARVIGWGINGLERQVYMMKNVKATGNYFSGWNDPVNWRCYWAEDRCYNVSDYPYQYRRAVDKTADFLYYQSKGEGNYLKNYSFNDLINTDINHVEYTPENTYNTDAVSSLGDRADLLAGTHIVIGAELLADIPVKGAMQVNPDLYRDYVGIFYDDARECFWKLIRTFIRDLSSQTKMKFYLYDWDGKETLTTMRTYEALTTGGEYKLWYNGRELDYNTVMSLDVAQFFAPALVAGGDGRVIPWIEGLTVRYTGSDPKKPSTLPIYSEIVQTVDPEDPSYGDLAAQNVANYRRELTTNDLKSLFLEWLGPVDHFAGSKMYYAAPAKLVTLTNGDKLYGVVRNQWYRFDLQGINAIGTSVDDLDQPILPDEVETKNRVSLIVDIIDWHRFTFTAPLL